MTSSELPVRNAVDRVIRIWSLIKMVPECSLSEVRSAVATALSKHGHRTENEMVLIGLKHLNQADGPNECQPNVGPALLPNRTKPGKLRRREALKKTARLPRRAI
jgi:hypothetical protein